MFVLKQFLKELLLPPLPWLLRPPCGFLAALLGAQAAAGNIFDNPCLAQRADQPMRCAIHWSRVTHRCSTHEKLARYDADPRSHPRDYSSRRIIPFPTIDERTFRRLDEAWRLYRIQRKPIIVSADTSIRLLPTRTKTNRRRLSDSLGRAQERLCWPSKSRDTFESAVEVHKLLQEKVGRNTYWSPLGAYAEQHAPLPPGLRSPSRRRETFRLVSSSSIPSACFRGKRGTSVVQYGSRVHRAANYYYRAHFSNF